MTPKSPATGIDITATLLAPRPHEELRRRPDGVRVRVLEGEDTGVELGIKSGRITVGRNALCEVVLRDPSVSQRHLTLTLDSGAVVLRDLGSRNGTWIGRARVDEAQLHLGAEFFAGNCKLRLEGIDMADVAVYREGRFGGVIGRSEPMRALFSKLERVAPTALDVLLLGETGTGKEVVARAIHEASKRSGPLVTVDCATLPRELADALLLGHAKGAFTGAVEHRAGPFEQAAGGTVFLDELGELPLDLQPKLLRVLDRREVTRIGETTPRPVDVRVIAATNRDLAAEVAEERFRLDLYHRIRSVELRLPVLRGRSEDVSVLAHEFLRRLGPLDGTGVPSLADDALRFLERQPWPGNVRELRMTIERAALLADGARVTLADITGWGTPPPSPTSRSWGELPLKEATDAFQRHYLDRLLRETNGDTRAAAERAGYSLRGLQALLQRLSGRENDGT